jgi:hypothetical protein
MLQKTSSGKWKAFSPSAKQLYFLVNPNFLNVRFMILGGALYGVGLPKNRGRFSGSCK